MGWETRGQNGRSYYYVKTRGEEGRVQSRYVGRGPVAVAAAELDALSRAIRDWRGMAISVVEADVDRADGAVRALTAAVKDELSAELESAGYRYHRGEWRRPKGGLDAEDAGEPEDSAGAEADNRPDGGEATPLGSPSPWESGSTERHPEPEGPTADDAALLSALLGPGGRDDDAVAEPHPVVPERRAPGPRPPEAEYAPPEWDPEWKDRYDVPGWDEDGAFVLTRPAAELRRYLGRDLAEGRVRVDHAALAPYRAGLGALARMWDRAVWERAARGLATGPVFGSPAWREAGAAERALAYVVSWGQGGDVAEGQDAVRARVASIREDLGWRGAAPLGRAVVDQFALAVAHEEALTMCWAASRTNVSPPVSLGGVEAAELLRVLGPGDDAEADRQQRAWGRRVARARFGTRDAARLVRHARKAGWLPPRPSVGGPT